MNKLPKKPTNEQFMNSNLKELGEWFKHNDTNTVLSMTCIYCGGRATQQDHVIPKSRGGKDDSSNIVPACTGCNANKGTMTPQEWKGISNKEFYFGSPRHKRMVKK